MKTVFKLFFRVATSLAICGAIAGLILVLYVNSQLPSVESLEDVKLQVPLRIYSQDNKLMGEYGNKRRTPVDISEVPEKLKYAIIATEDRRFYEHNGVDLRGLLRAATHLVTTGTKGQGASTITMQVARNFFLTRKKTFSRKLNEILLALKIEKELEKDEILELYLNKIYFGKRAYGVHAAAEVYYGKELKELTLGEMAMIAGLPKAPSSINPINNPKGAQNRRHHVLGRMLHYGFITEDEYQKANAETIYAEYHSRPIEFHAPYIAEYTRATAVSMFGEEIYDAGVEIYTTVDSRLQYQAQDAIQNGLLDYDKRHGFRGPLKHINLEEFSELEQQIAVLEEFEATQKLLPGLILDVTNDMAKALLYTGQRIEIPFDNMKWARKKISKRWVGKEPSSPSDVLNEGDIVYVEPLHNQWGLSQLPEAASALVAVNPVNGAIKAMVGGFDFTFSKFNRATQAYRQPGSNFKPFVYSAALENGFTAATIINDAPVVYHDDTLEGVWRPQNNSRKFYGPTRLRVGLTKSRNLVSIRLLQAVGIDTTIDVLERFGFSHSQLPRGLSLALGTTQVTPLDMATGFSTFANGGFKVEPFIIERIEDWEHAIVYQARPKIVCRECEKFDDSFMEKGTDTNIAKRIITPETAFIMNSFLQDAILTGTGRRAKSLQRRDIAGKTGTTNNQRDAWYTGYSPHLVTSVWTGYDNNQQSLYEYGSQVSLPIWIDFMADALKGVPESSFEQPSGIVTVKIDPSTGLLANDAQENAIFEFFTESTMPRTFAPKTVQPSDVVITPSIDGGMDTLF